MQQLPRILGIEYVPTADVKRILVALGCEIAEGDTHTLTVVAPSWRRDVLREIDLIEEVVH